MRAALTVLALFSLGPHLASAQDDWRPLFNGRNLSAAVAEWLGQEVLEPVPHRHVVLTIPRLLRPLFRRRRELLRDPARCAADALGAHVEGRLGEDRRPGIVVSIATAGDLAQWHPHLHVLASDGEFSAAGTFRPLEQWDGEAIMKLFRSSWSPRVREKLRVELVLAIHRAKEAPAPGLRDLAQTGAGKAGASSSRQ